MTSAMKIDGTPQGHLQEYEAQTDPVEQQLEKLEGRRRKIEEDIRSFRSTNPDPETARAEEEANRKANKALLRKLERKIESLEMRQNNSTSQDDDQHSSKSPNRTASSAIIDVFA